MVSISDDGNQDRVKKEMDDKIKLNKAAIERLQTICLQAAK